MCGGADVSQQNPLITTPSWVSTDRPRFVRDWTESSTVYVTTWGDRVHLFADCPGAKGFGADPTVKQVKLSNRVCTARKTCQRCFGGFWSGRSMEELNRMIEVLHGRIEDGPDRRTRSVIAEKISRRYGGAPEARPQRDPALLVTSRSDPTKSPRSVKKKTAEAPPSRSKRQTKGERDRAAAAALGVTVAELKERRRAENEANRNRKQSRQRGGER